MQIRSKWGTILVEYEYDAWGNCSIVYTHSAYGSFGEINPIRYRSYFYDFETGFYYLQSRYYDPAIRRFISADVYVSTGQGFIGCNMFAYCNNNPINLIDYSGQSATALKLWSSTMWWLTMVDGPIPVMDVVYAVIALSLVCLTLNTKPIPYTNITINSDNIDWNGGDKNHILKGSNRNHVEGWKKFGIDPDGDGAWELLLPILKQTVDYADSVTEKVVENGARLTYYAKYYADVGLNVIVKIWTSANGLIQKISDAWPK